MKNNKIEQLLYKKLDGRISEKETEKLSQEMANSEELRKTFRQISELRKQVSQNAEISFKPFFEERLLSKLNSFTPAAEFITSWTTSLALSFRQVAITAIIILFILISFNLNNGNKYSIENLLGISNSNIEYAFDPVDNLMGSLKL
jgi:hypothetical protein